MAKTPDAALALLSKVGPAAVKKAKSEIADMQAVIDKQKGGFKLQPWDWVAISVTNLNGAYLSGDPFAPFRPVEPSTRAGYSIFLYSTARADVQRAIADASVRLPWSTGIR